jgi:hypothetical protein
VPRRVLVTAGRSPAALELVRAFHRAGHRVVAVDTTRWCLCAASRTLARFHVLPWPSRSPAAFIDRLAEVVRRERVDLLVPVFEEIFLIAEARERFGPHCEVVADASDKLRRLHNKWTFNAWARELGFAVPRTMFLTRHEDVGPALAAEPELVFKPVYSRFGSDILIRPRPQRALDRVRPSAARPWIAQEYVPGRLICTYSVARAGVIQAHAAYAGDRDGVAISFRRLDHPATHAWVERFVSRIGFTGQIAFDFAERETGEPLALECNPRATSGVHLLAGLGDFPRAFFDAEVGPLTPTNGGRAMLASAMLATLPGRVFPPAEAGKWLSTFCTSRDVTFAWRDPLPFAFQFASWVWLVHRCGKYRVGLRQAGVMDLAWDGDG